MDVTTSDVSPISYEDRLQLIEQQELETPQGRLLPEVYCEFLSLYLLEGDLNNCKLLWKRIPTEIKTESMELTSIWRVCKVFFKRDFAGVYQHLNGFTWSEVTQRIMEELRLRHRSKCIDLIRRAYSEISTETAAFLMGYSIQECLETTALKGWEISEDNKTILIKKQQQSVTSSIDNASHLRKLTQYISFLET